MQTVIYCLHPTVLFPCTVNVHIQVNINTKLLFYVGIRLNCTYMKAFIVHVHISGFKLLPIVQDSEMTRVSQENASVGIMKSVSRKA